MNTLPPESSISLTSHVVCDGGSPELIILGMFQSRGELCQKLYRMLQGCLLFSTQLNSNKITEILDSVPNLKVRAIRARDLYASEQKPSFRRFVFVSKDSLFELARVSAGRP